MSEPTSTCSSIPRSLLTNLCADAALVVSVCEKACARAQQDGFVGAGLIAFLAERWHPRLSGAIDGMARTRTDTPEKIDVATALAKFELCWNALPQAQVADEKGVNQWSRELAEAKERLLVAVESVPSNPLLEAVEHPFSNSLQEKYRFGPWNNENEDIDQAQPVKAIELQGAPASRTNIPPAKQGEDRPAGSDSTSDPFTDFIGKERKLLLALHGKGKVKKGAVIRLLYKDSLSKHPDKAMDAVIKRANIKLACSTKTPRYEVKRKDEFLELKEVV